MRMTVSAALKRGAVVVFGSLAASSGHRCASSGHRRTPRSARVSAAMAAWVCVSAVVVFGAATAGSASPPSDTIATIAGTDYPGPSAATAIPVTPQAVAAAGGNLYVTDNQLSVVREINNAGVQTVIAGNGTYGYSGDGGPATSAALYDPESVAVDGAGNVVIADSGNNRIRVVAGSTGYLLRHRHDSGRHLHHRRQRDGAATRATAGRGPRPRSTSLKASPSTARATS
jgi:hypothetical protein